MADKTIKILFQAAAQYQTVPVVSYAAGEIAELREDIAMRWVKRGLATDDPELIAEAEAARSAEARPSRATVTLRRSAGGE